MAEEGEVAHSGEDVIMVALKDVIKRAVVHDGVARGLHQAVKALDRRQAHLCILSANVSEPAYAKLVEALCAEHKIKLMKVPDSKLLGEWVGLCKLDKDAKPRKVVKCSCCVIHNFGEESDSLTIIQDHLKKSDA